MCEHENALLLLVGDAPEDIFKMGLVKWLCQIRRGAGDFCFPDIETRAQPRDHEEWNIPVWVDIRHPAEQLIPSHSVHDEVGADQTGLPVSRLVLKKPDCVRRTLDGDHRLTELLEHFTKLLAKCFIVVDDYNWPIELNWLLGHISSQWFGRFLRPGSAHYEFVGSSGESLDATFSAVNTCGYGA